MIIKTKIEIGKFLNFSFVDGVPIREVTKDQLKTLKPSEYVMLDFSDNYKDILNDINPEQ